MSKDNLPKNPDAMARYDKPLSPELLFLLGILKELTEVLAECLLMIAITITQIARDG